MSPPAQSPAPRDPERPAPPAGQETAALRPDATVADASSRLSGSKSHPGGSGQSVVSRAGTGDRSGQSVASLADTVDRSDQSVAARADTVDRGGESLVSRAGTGDRSGATASTRGGGSGSTASAKRIAQLALPALVVLAAEPLYVLVDTAVVGHLGSLQLAAVAVGGTTMSVAAWLGTLMAYGTTGRAARRFGAGDRGAAVAEGVQASWLALAVGVLLALLAQPLAGPLAQALSGDPATAEAAAGWLRVAALGAPGLLLAAAGNGWMRGVQDTRRPLIFVLGANVLSAILCPVLVYPVGWGLTGSAVANVVAQSVSGGFFLYALVRETRQLRPSPQVIGQQLRLGRDLLIRGAAFQACFLSATAVASRFGVESVGAHQIALQLWFFSALALDAVAIAAQSLVGAALGGGSAAEARTVARKVTVAGGLAGVVFALLAVAGSGHIAGWFTPDAGVHDRAALIWPWFIGLMPFAGVVYALDGVLIGAGDVRFLRDITLAAAVLGFLPAIWIAYFFDLGLGGIWAGLALLILIRFATTVWRWRSGRWVVTGVTR